MDYDLFSLILLVKKRGGVKQNSVRASRLKKFGSHLDGTTPTFNWSKVWRGCNYIVKQSEKRDTQKILNNYNLLIYNVLCFIFFG